MKQLMNRSYRSIGDESDLKLALEFIAYQKQQYGGKHQDWTYGKCKAGIESGKRPNIVVYDSPKQVSGVIILKPTKSHSGEPIVEISNIRVDPEFRRRDIAHHLLKQTEFYFPGTSIITDTHNPSVANFLLANGFQILDIAELHNKGQKEIIFKKNRNPLTLMPPINQINHYTQRVPKKTFNDINNNKKIIETRLLDDKRRKFKLGDELTFLKRPKLEEMCHTRIVGLHKFSSFEQLTNNFPLTSFGSTYKNQQEYLDELYSYYSHKKEQKKGVIGIEFRKIPIQ